MNKNNPTLFIYDDEIRKRFADRSSDIITLLDQDGLTKAGYATWPKGARSRTNVEIWLKANGYNG